GWAPNARAARSQLIAAPASPSAAAVRPARRQRSAAPARSPDNSVARTPARSTTNGQGLGAGTGSPPYDETGVPAVILRLPVERNSRSNLASARGEHVSAADCAGGFRG